MDEEQKEKILDALIDFWYCKVLDKMATTPYPDFDEALEQVKKEMSEP